jgi:HPt (histidine-containing phosphotransfer) domain-containing protein
MEDNLIDLPQVAGVNVKDFAAKFGGAEGYTPIVEAFVRGVDKLLVELRNPDAATNTDNLADYAIKVHGIKGAAYGIGAQDFGDAAFELEKLAKGGDLTTVLEKNGAFMEKAENISALLKDFLSKIKAATAAAQPAGSRPRLSRPPSALLEKIRAAAARFRSSELDPLIIELRSADYDDDGGLAEAIADAADNLDYDAIVERIGG